jgi:hypothetical protein
VWDPLVRQNNHVNDTSKNHSLLDLLSHPLEWGGDSRVFLPWHSCWDFLVELMDLFRNLTTTFSNWWPIFHPPMSAFCFFYCLPLFFNIICLNCFTLLLRYFKSKHLAITLAQLELPGFDPLPDNPSFPPVTS